MARSLDYESVGRQSVGISDPLGHFVLFCKVQKGGLERLDENCPGCVIIKLGKEGSVTKTKEGTYQHPAFSIEAQDTTGAGDSFNAGVIFGFLNSWDIRKTLRFANALAAMAITRPKGAGYPTLKDVKDYLKNSK